MGFNKRILNKEQCFNALKYSSLRSLYGKSDMLIFEDEISSQIYQYYKQGETDDQIAKKFEIERVTSEHNR